MPTDLEIQLTNAQPSHSPTPWRWGNHPAENTPSELLDANGATVMRASQDSDWNSCFEFANEETADRILRAVNNHAALVAALTELVAAEDASQEVFTANEIDRLEAAITKGRAALAAAKGQT